MLFTMVTRRYLPQRSKQPVLLLPCTFDVRSITEIDIFLYSFLSSVDYNIIEHMF